MRPCVRVEELCTIIAMKPKYKVHD